MERIKRKGKAASMTGDNTWAIGVDLGGTKVKVGRVDWRGTLLQVGEHQTQASNGPASVKGELIRVVKSMVDEKGIPPVGLGVGVAGQVDAGTGAVRFAPNLGWKNEPFGEELKRALGIPVSVTNDVRAATWGEWLHGAGKGFDDVVCLFVGTGIGGGVVSGGKVLSGCSNSAGELGHITVALGGSPCGCGNQGCLEAMAGGWAIAREAQEAVATDPTAGASIVKMAGGRREAITAQTVVQALRAGDPLAARIMDRMIQALIAGVVSLVNAFNPCRFILGGGVIEGMPEIVDRVAAEVPRFALGAASAPLKIVRAGLRNDAGVIGAAALVMRTETEGLKEK